MARFLKSRQDVAGKSPEELIFVGRQKVDEPVIHIMNYTADTLQEQELDSPRDCAKYLTSDSITWVNVYGLHDTPFIKKIAGCFNIHPLALEDILNTGQRAKIEDYDDTIYLVLKSLRFDAETNSVNSDQFSLVIGKNFLISFHEQPVDTFKPVRDRLIKQKGRIRRNGTDYLAYALLDAVVDNYMVTIEALGGQIEDIEDDILNNNSTQDVLSNIIHYKHEVSYLRKSIQPARELIAQIIKIDSDLIREETLPFYKDLLGLATQAVEVLETYREILNDDLNSYNTAISNKLNEIMKVLTIFAAIFIPLTFIAGIYGTNFEYLPELHFKYSYYIFWGVLIAIAAFMLRFFKRKRWI